MTFKCDYDPNGLISDIGGADFSIEEADGSEHKDDGSVTLVSGDGENIIRVKSYYGKEMTEGMAIKLLALLNQSYTAIKR